MEIIWNSKNSFTITTNNGTILINPASREASKDADIVLFSNAASNVEKTRERASDNYEVTWPGEYEANNILVVGVEADHDDEETLETMYSITTPEGISLGFIGAVTKRPDSKSLEKLGNVDILLINIDESSDVKSKEMVGMIEVVESKVVIPFFSNEDSVASLVKALAEPLPEAQKSFKVQKSQIDTEGTSYILLQNSQG